MQCYRHPRIETGVSCGKCDRPICPKCMVDGPAGMRCPDCASLRQNALYKIPPTRLALAVVAGLVTGVIGALLIAQITFFVFFVGPIYGGIVAEAILRAAGRKRGHVLEVIGVGSIVLGAIVACAFPLLSVILLTHVGHTPTPANGPDPNAGTDSGPASYLLAGGLMGCLWPLVGCGLGISTCYARLKYW